MRRQEVGFVYQFHHLLPEFSAAENVAMPLRIARVVPQQARPRAEALLAEVGLSDRLSHRPGMLSGGEQQRVAVARALVMQPALLLADEPTGYLDQQTGEQVSDLLFDLVSEQGMTLVLVTHNQELARSCTRQHTLPAGALH